MKTAAGEPAAGAALAAQAGRGHAVGWRWAAAGAVLVAAGGIAAGSTGAFGGPAHPAAGLAGNAYRTATATVIRRSLSAQTQVTATLGDAGAYTVVNQAQGTLTAVPAVGQVVREGQVLYQVSGSPVVLLPGAVPAYRSLSEGMTGADVTELNAALVALGYATRAELDPHSDYISAETGYALGRLQLRLGLPQTGVLALGQAVFLPGAVQITALSTSTVLGGPATPGTSLLAASSTTPVVTIDLDAAQQTEVKAGQPVTITLPGNQDTPGVVSSVGTVAAASPSGSTSGSSSCSSGDSGSSPTITVEVRLSDPKAAGRLNQAPVEVTITTGSVRSALVVPVDALLAQSDGRYAVEVAGARGTRHLVAVSAGLFDDADGLVQVTGPGLAAGQHVVVPAT